MKISEYNRVLLAFDSIIKVSLEAMERESSVSCRGADASDDYIKFYRERAAKLRAIRQGFEDLMAQEPERGV